MTQCACTNPVVDGERREAGSQCGAMVDDDEEMCAYCREVCGVWP